MAAWCYMSNIIQLYTYLSYFIIIYPQNVKRSSALPLFPWAMVKHHNRVRFKSGDRKAFREPAAESCAAASFGLDPNGPTSKKQRIAPKNLDCQVPATKKHSRRKGKLQIGAKVIRIHPISSNWQISVRYQAANNGSPLPHKPERQATEAAHHGSDALHHWNQQWKTSNGQHIRHISEFLECFNLFLDHLGSNFSTTSLPAALKSSVRSGFVCMISAVSRWRNSSSHRTAFHHSACPNVSTLLSNLKSLPKINIIWHNYNILPYHGSLNVPIEHHPTIRYMVYNGYYKVMSNIPKMGQLPTPAIWFPKISKAHRTVRKLR